VQPITVPISLPPGQRAVPRNAKQPCFRVSDLFSGLESLNVPKKGLLQDLLGGFLPAGQVQRNVKKTPCVAPICGIHVTLDPVRNIRRHSPLRLHARRARVRIGRHLGLDVLSHGCLRRPVSIILREAQAATGPKYQFNHP
jgi:hypothetical protein